MHLRLASPDDADALADLTQAAIAALPGTQYSPDERTAWRISVSAEAMRHGIEDSETVTVIAEMDGDVVGYSTLDGATVRAVYVRPDSQGQGVGSGLLDAVEMKAQTRGVQALDVFASLNSVGFYERHGYERTGKSTVEIGGGIEMCCVNLEKALG